MAAAKYVPSEDQFLCSICLDVFTDPVTIPCGHNFCKTCITEHWNTNDMCQCPMCKQVFTTRPDLKVNTFISEMVAQFRQSAQQEASSSSEQEVSNPGEVPCDICTRTKLKALKSCLVCLVSYCETHLQSHLTLSGLKRHQLIDPVENLEDRMCKQHDKPLELFCKTDQMCVCLLCTVIDHKTHEVVPLKEGYEEKKAKLRKTNTELQQMIQERRLKIQEVKHSVELSKEGADRETAEGVQVFTALKECVDRSLDEFIKTIEKKQKATEKQADIFIKDLEQEISELKKRSTEVEQISQSEDHLHLLQSVDSLNINHPPSTRVWSEVSVRPASYEGTVVRAVSQLEETLSKELKMLLEADLKRVQQYAVDVTLDPDVSGKQSFSSGRFYFDVQVKGKTWDFGVTRESVNRKEDIPLSPQKGYWTIGLRYGTEYKAFDDHPVRLSLKSQPQKVGVFVDYEEGLVFFYDVKLPALIYSFTGCSFTGNLFPYFSPRDNDGGANSACLIFSAARADQHVPAPIRDPFISLELIRDRRLSDQRLSDQRSASSLAVRISKTRNKW
uniref:E3 ubiquitin-protein ligase TRIM21-like n=1 Tax=Scatophagus argus TaxID=75038 RepID=UPI001ED803D1|nr:E3 ubiquitin-protein ligase TRIM21-like [Scatophagus argus]